MKILTLKEHFNAFRVETSLKLTLAGIICIFINNIFHFDLGYLSTLFVFMILIIAHGDTFKVGAQSLLGVITSCAVTITITYLFVESKVLYLLLTGVWLFLCMTFVYRYFLPTLLSGIAATLTVYAAIYFALRSPGILVRRGLRTSAAVDRGSDRAAGGQFRGFGLRL